MDSGVEGYIGKQKQPQKRIIQELRKIIKATFPGIKEEMKWGVPVFGGGRYYVVALKDHVNLGFSVRGLSKKEQDLLEGKGKMMRHIKVNSLNEIDMGRIVKLLKMAKKARCSAC